MGIFDKLFGRKERFVRKSDINAETLLDELRRQKRKRGIVVIPKEDILRNNFGTVQKVISSLIEEIKITKRFPTLVRLEIDGYNNDPRELWEIPEVISWYGNLHFKYGFLPFFLDEGSIQLYLSHVMIFKDDHYSYSDLEELEEIYGIGKDAINTSKMTIKRGNRKKVIRDINMLVVVTEVYEKGNQLINETFSGDNDTIERLIDAATQRISSVKRFIKQG